MAKLKTYLFEKLFNMSSGYVMSFTNYTFQQFILNSTDLDIQDVKYGNQSKANRLREFIKLENATTVKKLLTDFLNYYENDYDLNDSEQIKDLTQLKKCQDELTNILDNENINSFKTSQLNDFKQESLIELKKTLDAELKHGRYNTTLDRLHTYCVAYFQIQCKATGIDHTDKPLESISAEYFRYLNKNLKISQATSTVLKMSQSVWKEFNHVRNNKSLAHHNELLNNNEAKLILEWVMASLEFIESIKDAPAA